MPDQNEATAQQAQQPREIELQDAYRETCTALGEAVTMQRLLSSALAEAQARLAAVTKDN